MIDFEELFAGNLPRAAGRWAGFPHYNFIGGHNDPDMIPIEGLIASAGRALAREGRTLATYNMDGGALGHPGLREFVAGKLARTRGIQATAGDILITSGSLQGLDLVNEILIEPGDTVIMEAFTYQGSIARAKRRGARIVGVPLDEEGLRVDALEETLAGLGAKGVRPKYIYTIPTIQNPTGTVMPLERRRALLALAHKYGVPVFEDECYADLLWDGAWPPALKGMEGGDEVIHIGSFSKSLAPALRLGYVDAPFEVTSRLLACKDDGGTPALEQMIVADYVTANFDSHVRRLKEKLRRKLAVLAGALEENFGTAADFRLPKGGIFLWVRLPDAVDTLALAGPAREAGIAFNPGPEWSTDPEAARHSLRLCFGHPSESQIRDGIAALAAVCHRETGVPARSANVVRDSPAGGAPVP